MVRIVGGPMAARSKAVERSGGVWNRQSGRDHRSSGIAENANRFVDVIDVHVTTGELTHGTSATRLPDHFRHVTTHQLPIPLVNEPTALAVNDLFGNDRVPRRYNRR